MRVCGCWSLQRFYTFKSSHGRCFGRLAARDARASRWQGSWLRYTKQVHWGRGAFEGICFDATCQGEADKLFLTSLFAPSLFALLLLLLWRSGQEKGSKGVFDSNDGNAIQSPSGAVPGRDIKGEVVYRPNSYTPWPVDESAPGERLRVPVGPVSDLQNISFVFDRLLSKSSSVFSVSLPRPMGIVFEEEARTGRVVVADLLEGTAAHQKSQIARLDSKRGKAAEKGDVLRACTCTNFVYGRSALIGARAPTRTIVLYGADNQRWSQVMTALKRGDPSDGPVTLILERL